MRTLRLLKDKERALLTALMMESLQATQLVESLNQVLVEEMDDGGMGSLRFHYSDSKSRHFAKRLIDREFVDSDGVPVRVAINLDEYGDIYDLDVWKVDFSPLRRFPVLSKKHDANSNQPCNKDIFRR